MASIREGSSPSYSSRDVKSTDQVIYGKAPMGDIAQATMNDRPDPSSMIDPRPVTVDERFELSPDGDPHTTWKNAVDSVIRRSGGGRYGTYDLLRQDKDLAGRNPADDTHFFQCVHDQLFKSKEAERRGLRNRYCGVQIICKRGGKPRVKPRVRDAERQRQTRSEKADLTHNHEPPNRPRLEDGFLDKTLIAERGGEIEALTRMHWRPSQVYTYLTKDGKKMDEAGKLKVRNLMGKFRLKLNNESNATPSGRHFKGAAAPSAGYPLESEDTDVTGTTGSGIDGGVGETQSDDGLEVPEASIDDIPESGLTHVPVKQHTADFAAHGKDIMAREPAALKSRDAARGVIYLMKKPFKNALEPERTVTQRIGSRGGGSNNGGAAYRSSPIENTLEFGSLRSSATKVSATPAGRLASRGVMPPVPAYLRSPEIKREVSAAEGGMDAVQSMMAMPPLQEVPPHQQGGSAVQETRTKNYSFGEGLPPEAWVRSVGFAEPQTACRPRVNYPSTFARPSPPAQWGGTTGSGAPAAVGNPPATSLHSVRLSRVMNVQRDRLQRDSRRTLPSLHVHLSQPSVSPPFMGSPPGRVPSEKHVSEPTQFPLESTTPTEFPWLPRTNTSLPGTSNVTGTGALGEYPRFTNGMGDGPVSASDGTTDFLRSTAATLGPDVGTSFAPDVPSMPSPRPSFGTLPLGSYTGETPNHPRMRMADRAKRPRSDSIEKGQASPGGLPPGWDQAY